MRITVGDLANELGITPAELGRIVGLKSSHPAAFLPDDYADRIRAEARQTLGHSPHGTLRSNAMATIRIATQRLTERLADGTTNANNVEAYAGALLRAATELRVSDMRNVPLDGGTYWLCGCLINTQESHRVGCPDFPDGRR